MASLETAAQSPFVKALVIGDSGSGKTGALVSLVAAGYKVRILDMDNKVAEGILPHAIRRFCPDKMKNVDFISVRDVYKSSALGPIVDGLPKAYAQALGYLDKWDDGSIPSKWGKDTVFVLDSFSFLGDAAYNWARGMNPSAKDPRQWYYAAQDACETNLAQLTARSFETNVLVMCHIAYQNRPDGAMKGFPALIGKALGPKIPGYFDNMILVERDATTKKVTVKTAPTALLDLKNSASFTMSAAMPVETGLADFFKQLKGQ